VDNASTDGSVEMIKSQFPRAHLIENESNRGFAAAINQGLAIAKGRYALLLNSDTLVLDDAIAKTVEFADGRSEAAVVGCRVLNTDKTLQSTCFMFPSILNMLLSASYFYKLFPKSKFFGRERMTWWDRHTTKEVDVATGCFMLVRREAIDQVGTMDEQFFMYGEETDWCYRFKKTGWKILFTPNAEVIHLGGESSRKMSPEMTLQLRASILQFVCKHYSRFEYILACILVWFFLALRVPRWFLKSLGGRTERSQSRTQLVIYLLGMKRLMFNGPKGLGIQQSDRKS